MSDHYYRFYYRSYVTGHEGVFSFDAPNMTACDGFWLSRDFEYNTYDERVYYFSPHTIVHIEKIYHQDLE